MSIGDTIFIFFLALIFFGPKKLPELARQLGKLVAEFRRASNEFRFQMEEEMRAVDQAESQKKLAELQSVKPGEAAPAIAEGAELSIMPPATGLPVGESTNQAFAMPIDGLKAVRESKGLDGIKGVEGEAGDPANPAAGGYGGLPVEHQPRRLSGMLGPPSQADAVNVEQVVQTSTGQTVQTGAGPGFNSNLEPSTFNPADAFAQDLHGASSAMEPAGGKIEAAHEEVHTTNG